MTGSGGSGLLGGAGRVTSSWKVSVGGRENFLRKQKAASFMFPADLSVADCSPLKKDSRTISCMQTETQLLELEMLQGLISDFLMGQMIKSD